MDVMQSLPSEFVDCVFADPPFNLGKNYNNGKSDLLADEHYLNWCRLWITESIRILKPGGAMFIYNLPRWAYQLAAYLEEKDMEFRHWIAVSMKGTFPRGNKLYPAHYALLYFTKGTPKTFNRVRLPIPTCRHCGKDIKDYGGHRKYLNPEGLNLTDFWEDTSPARHSKNKSRWHINELKPTIPERCIRIATSPGDIVFDPFGGGGSTYVTAEHLHRFWIGAEIGPCEPIWDRFVREFPELKWPKTLPTQIRLPLRQKTSSLVHV
jgi:site-specific DNA-methyltransferase (adenine-specific)